MMQLVDAALTRTTPAGSGSRVCEDEMDRKRGEAVQWPKRCISARKEEAGALVSVGS